ncbi:MAG: Lrp/AsnC ligand binding domain-containing protein [Spirochaetes bacterium]|nr:Lrp/AsnC ligand binding domain-containing protein [Spirochaetota bacterium]
MSEQYEMDHLEKQILKELQDNGRRHFQELARDLDVSGGTIHVRYAKLKEMGVIKGSKVIIAPETLGYDVCAFIGINLKSADVYQIVLDKLREIPEVIEAHYTTGGYSIFIKVYAHTTQGLYELLVQKIQSIDGVLSTESFISLEMPIDRDIPISE